MQQRSKVCWVENSDRHKFTRYPMRVTTEPRIDPSPDTHASRLRPFDRRPSGCPILYLNSWFSIVGNSNSAENRRLAIKYCKHSVCEEWPKLRRRHESTTILYYLNEHPASRLTWLLRLPIGLLQQRHLYIAEYFQFITDYKHRRLKSYTNCISIKIKIWSNRIAFFLLIFGWTWIDLETSTTFAI